MSSGVDGMDHWGRWNGRWGRRIGALELLLERNLGAPWNVGMGALNGLNPNGGER